MTERNGLDLPCVRDDMARPVIELHDVEAVFLQPASQLVEALDRPLLVRRNRLELRHVRLDDHEAGAVQRP
jgi:hypothetical protein